MKKITLLFTVAVFAISAKAQILYTFDSVKTTSGLIDPSPLPATGGSITVSSFSATGTAANSSAAARFDFANWPLGSTGGAADTLFSGMTGSINTSEYYEVTLSPAAGFTMTGDSIKFTFERSGTGIRTYAVRSSLDGYTTNLTAVYVAPNINVDVQAGNIFFLKKDNLSINTRNVIVLGAAFMNLASPVTFRFYAWNAEGASGTFSIDNVNFIGSSAVASGISEKTTESIELYPNPSSTGVFTLETGVRSVVNVYNIIGKLISSKDVAAGKQMIDLSAQPNGSYFVSIKNENGTVTKKVIVTK